MKIDLVKFKAERLAREARKKEVEKLGKTSQPITGVKPELKIVDFESFKARTKISETGCWEWQGAIKTTGYGMAHYFGKQWRAHRLAYELSVGTIIGNMFVCHKCDNKRCVNPDHLYLGTHVDNMKDCAAKQRTTTGKSKSIKLRTEIIKDFNKYVSTLQIRYDIKRESILRILKSAK